MTDTAADHDNTEIEPGTGFEADTTMDDVSAAFDELEAAGAQEQLEAEEQAVAAQVGQPRAADGKFAAKAQEQAEQAIQNAEQAQATAVEMPQSWGAKRAELWSKAPPEVQAYIVEREQQMAEGVKRFEGLAEYAEMAEKNGLQLNQVMQNYINAEQKLANDFPAAIADLCVLFKQDPAQLAAQLTGQAAQQGQQPQQQQAPQIPPEYAQRLQGLEQTIQQQRIEAANAQVNEFKSNPEHKYFDQVEPIMADLMKVARQNGEHLSLKDAYDKAIWMQPEVRQQVLQDQAKQQEQDRINQAKTASDKARKAGKSLNGSTSGTPPKNTTLAQDVEAAYEQLAS